MLETYINQLIIDLDISEDVSTDIEGCYKIQIDKNITVIIKTLQPGYSFTAVVSSLPKTSCEELFTYMMSGNLLGIGTGETLLGLDEQGKTVTLSQSVTYETKYQEFHNNLEDFANYVAFWQREISKYLEHN